MFDRIFCALAVAGLMFTSALAAPSTRPNAPKTVCVNNKCVTTSDGSATQIKWNPGHYMASGNFLNNGTSLSSQTGEMDDLAGFDKIVGYRILITWSAIEKSKGQYDFSLLDGIMSRLKTHYGKPRQLVVVLMPGEFGGTIRSSSDDDAIPQYILQSGEYGAGMAGGTYGWWGKSVGYSAALYRPAVMDRWIALIQAVGAHFDSDPNFEAVMFQEDSWMMDLWAAGAPDYDKSGTGAVEQLKRMLTAATAAFPHTSVIMENTWAGTVSQTYAFQQWMAANRIAPGSADVVGQSAFDNYSFAQHLAWGLQAYCGFPNGSATSPDLRPQSRSMMDVEGAELGGGYFKKYGGAYTPLDIINALNKTYKSSHAFWTHFVGTETWLGVLPDGVKWKNMAQTLSANPLTNTDYPANYN